MKLYNYNELKEMPLNELKEYKMKLEKYSEELSDKIYKSIYVATGSLGVSSLSGYLLSLDLPSKDLPSAAVEAIILLCGIGVTLASINNVINKDHESNDVANELFNIKRENSVRKIRK